LSPRPANFDRLAPFYRAMELISVAGKMQRCRLAWLDKVTDARDVLIVGEGPGRFLPLCAQALPNAEILCVDGSHAMLARAKQSLQKTESNSSRVTFLQATLPEWQPPIGKFDLIVTCFFLDCFSTDQLPRIVELLAFAAQPKARWLLADFCIPDRGFSRLRAQLIIAATYAFFRWATKIPGNRLIPPGPQLGANGFQLCQRATYDWGMMYSELWSRDPVTAR
jgi:ubiquinone/menaquinone biosynthesis C-methylase UbiE